MRGPKPIRPGNLKGGLPITDSTQLDDLQEPDFLRALARAALSR